MYGEAVGAFALICGNDPLRGDLIRRFAPPVRPAVPENPVGLTLFLAVLPLRKLRPCFFCRRQRKAAIPPQGEAQRAIGDASPYI